MDISFIYTQKRKHFGKPCTFSNVGPFLLTDIESNNELQNEFYTVPTVDKEVDNSTRVCIQEVNTETHPTENRGMNHTEGGWPASVDIADEDSTTRFRKKITKDKNYVTSVMAMGKFLETFVMENNSIDIYEEYFVGEDFSAKDGVVLNISCVLPNPFKTARKVLDISWSLDGTKIAGAYSINALDFSPIDLNMDSYVWDIHSNVAPFCILSPEFSLNCVSFSPYDLNSLLTGYNNGEIGIWDIRTSGHAQKTSNVHDSHIQKVTGIKWLRTASKMNILSASTDGKIMLWDTRNVLKPIQAVSLDPDEKFFPNINKRYNISCLEYDPTVTNKFMLGTEQGSVLSINRKSDEKLLMIYDCQLAPIVSLERNAFFPQLFASCDPWTTRIWSEENNVSPLLNMRCPNGFCTDIAWSPDRPSLLLVTNTTGAIDVWVIPGKHNKPIASISLEKEALTSIQISDTNSIIACGSAHGKINILTASDSFKTASNEEIDLVSKYIVGSMYENVGKPRHERLGEEEEDMQNLLDLKEALSESKKDLIIISKSNDLKGIEIDLKEEKIELKESSEIKTELNPDVIVSDSSSTNVQDSLNNTIQSSINKKEDRDDRKSYFSSQNDEDSNDKDEIVDKESTIYSKNDLENNLVTSVPSEAKKDPPKASK